MNVTGIIDLLGGEAMTAAKLGVHQTTVQYWIRTGSIPKDHWKKIIELTNGEITADILLEASVPSAA